MLNCYFVALLYFVCGCRAFFLPRKMDNKIASRGRMAAFRLPCLTIALLPKLYSLDARASPTAFARTQARAAASDLRRRRPTLSRCYRPLLQASRHEPRDALSWPEVGEGGTRHCHVGGLHNPRATGFCFQVARDMFEAFITNVGETQGVTNVHTYTTTHLFDVTRLVSSTTRRAP